MEHWPPPGFLAWERERLEDPRYNEPEEDGEDESQEEEVDDGNE